jgi:hypothetical protein
MQVFEHLQLLVLPYSYETHHHLASKSDLDKHLNLTQIANRKSLIMIYYAPISLKALKRTSKRGSGGSESGRGCKPRPYACVEWTSELQGETNWGLTPAGAATVIWAKGIAEFSRTWIVKLAYSPPSHHRRGC